MNSDLLYSKNSCLVPFENYCVETKKYIKIFENFLAPVKLNLLIKK